MSEWNNRRFGELFDVIYRYPTYFGIEYIDNGVPEIRGELLSFNGRLSDDYRFISHDTASKFPKVRLKPGDFIMSVRGTLGKIGLAAEEHANAVITANLLRLSPNHSMVDSGWLLQVFTSLHFQEQLDNASSQTTIKTIQVPQLCDLPVDLPPLPEQRKIARILTTVDNLIEQTEALIEKYKSIKQGMMHDLFTRGVDSSGQLRPPYEDAPELYKESELGWISKEWEASFLRDIATRLHQGINTAADTIKYERDGYKILQAKHITSCTIEDGDARFVSRSDFDFYRERFCPALGNILFTNIGTIGKSLVIDDNSEFLIAWNIFLIDLESKQSPYFVNYYLTWLDQNGFYDEFAGGNATRFINKSQIGSFSIPIPPPGEQEAITRLLQSIDHTVERETQACSTFMTIKAGLMQDLLTGKVRVNVDECEEVTANV